MESVSVPAAQNRSADDYILIVDWTQAGAQLSASLETRGHATVVTSNVTSALGILSGRRPLAIVCELQFPGGSATAFDLLDAVAALDRPVPVVILTAFSSTSAAFAAIKRGAHDFLSKPATVEEVLFSLSLHAWAQPKLEHPPPAWMTLDSVAERYIQDTCELAGSITKAAHLLGVDRKSLKRRMVRYARLRATPEQDCGATARPPASRRRQ